MQEGREGCTGGERRNKEEGWKGEFADITAFTYMHCVLRAQDSVKVLASLLYINVCTQASKPVPAANLTRDSSCSKSSGTSPCSLAVNSTEERLRRRLAAKSPPCLASQGHVSADTRRNTSSSLECLSSASPPFSSSLSRDRPLSRSSLFWLCSNDSHSIAFSPAIMPGDVFARSVCV